MSQRRLAKAEPILRDATRVLRAHHLVDAIFADMQVARLASSRGDLQASEAEFREIRAEARRLGERHSQLEAAVYLPEIRLHRCDAGGAMDF